MHEWTNDATAASRRFQREPVSGTSAHSRQAGCLDTAMNTDVQHGPLFRTHTLKRCALPKRRAGRLGARPRGGTQEPIVVAGGA
jgi:hypothetical protein